MCAQFAGWFKRRPQLAMQGQQAIPLDHAALDGLEKYSTGRGTGSLGCSGARVLLHIAQVLLHILLGWPALYAFWQLLWGLRCVRTPRSKVVLLQIAQVLH